MSRVPDRHLCGRCQSRSRRPRPSCPSRPWPRLWRTDHVRDHRLGPIFEVIIGVPDQIAAFNEFSGSCSTSTAARRCGAPAPTPARGDWPGSTARRRPQPARPGDRRDAPLDRRATGRNPRQTRSTAGGTVGRRSRCRRSRRSPSVTATGTGSSPTSAPTRSPASGCKRHGCKDNCPRHPPRGRGRTGPHPARGQPRRVRAAQQGAHRGFPARAPALGDPRQTSRDRPQLRRRAAPGHRPARPGAAAETHHRARGGPRRLDADRRPPPRRPTRHRAVAADRATHQGTAHGPHLTTPERYIVVITRTVQQSAAA